MNSTQTSTKLFAVKFQGDEEDRFLCGAHLRYLQGVIPHRVVSLREAAKSRHQFCEACEEESAQ